MLQCEAWPVGATIFRKSAYASQGTHAHQDLSYAWRPGSQLFSCTTWVALTPASASPLKMLPASHLNGIEAAVDFLDPSFQDRVSSKEWDKAVTLEVDLEMPSFSTAASGTVLHLALGVSGWPLQSHGPQLQGQMEMFQVSTHVGP